MSITWEEFKQCIEDQGVKDDMEVDYIDWNGTDCRDPEVNDHGDNSFSI